jgi:hypothetical protein
MIEVGIVYDVYVEFKKNVYNLEPCFSFSTLNQPRHISLFIF